MTGKTTKVTLAARGASRLPDPTVGASHVCALLELAVSKGGDRGRLLAQSGLDEGLLVDPDNRVPVTKFKSLMRAGQKLARDPALALHWGEGVAVPEHSIVTLVGQGSTTFSDAFALQNRFARLAIEVEVEGGGDRFALVRDEMGVWLHDRRANPNEFPELTEAGFARMACSARRLGRPGLLKAVHVTHDPPEYRDEYARIFQVPVRFKSNKNALLLGDDAWLTQSLAVHPPYVFELLKARAEALLKELDEGKTFRGRVEALLIQLLHTGDVGMAQVAAQLELTPRTLLRRLKAEGATFEKLLDELRYRLAVRYLQEQAISLNDVASLLGYSERAAFARAFRRWTGSSPGKIRKAKGPDF